MSQMGVQLTILMLNVSKTVHSVSMAVKIPQFSQNILDVYKIKSFITMFSSTDHPVPVS
jgi:hypothetical protein